MEKLIETLHAALKTRKMTLAVAESCTGGMLGAKITDVPGAADIFDRGFITYSNQAKIQVLGVKPALIAKHGAVSKEVAREMAVGAIKKSTANVSIAVTGIAGPRGGDKEKPVGLVFIAVGKKGAFVQVRENNFKGTRKKIREQSVETAIKMLLEILER